MRALPAGRASLRPGAPRQPAPAGLLASGRCGRLLLRAEAARGPQGAANAADTSATLRERVPGDAEDCKVQSSLSALDAFLAPASPPAVEPAAAPAAPAPSAEQAVAKRAQSGAEASTSAASSPAAASPTEQGFAQSLWAFALHQARNYVKPTTLVSKEDTDLPRAQPRLAYAVLAANLLVYGTGLSFRFLEGDIGPQDFFLSLASVNEAVEAGEYYRIVSANFLHDSFVHLCASSYALLTIAPEAEAVLGPFAFLTTYLLAGAAGTTLCFLLTDTLTVGASSGIFGLIGALGAFLFKNHKVPNSGDQLLFMAGLLAFNLIMGHKQESAIDNLGHLGGLLAGIYLGWLLTAAVLKQPLPDAGAAAAAPTAEHPPAQQQPGELPEAGAGTQPVGAQASVQASVRAGAQASVRAGAPAEAPHSVRVVQPSPLQSAVVLLSVSTTIASGVAAAVLWRTGELPLPRWPVWLPF